MSESYEVVVIFPVYGQLGAIQKLDFGLMVHEFYCYNNNDLLSDKS